MSNQQPVVPAAMLRPHCMSMSDSATVTCSRCGAPISDESLESAPWPGTSDGGGGAGTLPVRPATTSAFDESAYVDGAPVSAEARQPGFNGIRVVFREDGSAVLECSLPAPGESADDEPLAAPPLLIDSLPTPVEPAARAAEVPAIEPMNGPPIASVPSPRVQWIAASAERGSMTAFAVGAAVATLVLVCGHIVYRSLAPSDAPRLAEERPVAAAFEELASERVVERIQAEPALTARLRSTTAAALVGDSPSTRPMRIAP